MATENVVRKKLQIGPYQVSAIETGIFGLDGGAMFGTVPKVLWEKSNPADAQNRIEMQARVLLLSDLTSHPKSPRHVLVDCGIGGDFIDKYGEKLGAKFAEMYAVNADSSVTATLRRRGIEPEQITEVILTHLHFDHAGGATTSLQQGKLVPTFPKAKYYLQRANLQTARAPNLRERASYFAANFEPLLAANCLHLLDGAVENLLPQISVYVTNGHTLGQQVVRVSDGSNHLLYCADLIPTASHVRLAWVMGYDLEPLKLIDEKRAFLATAARENWHLFFEHDAYCDAALVVESKGDFMVAERLKLLDA